MTKKKTTASERYWEKRRELEDKARLKLEKKTLNELESVFERALVKIQRPAVVTSRFTRYHSK